MYARRKMNASGSTSIQVVQKVNGRVKILKTIGSSKVASEIEELYQLAHEQIMTLRHAAELPFHQNLELQYVSDFKNSFHQLRLAGPELLLGKIFDEIGFNATTDELFRHLVITRLVYPVSKLKTVDYLGLAK